MPSVTQEKSTGPRRSSSESPGPAQVLRDTNLRIAAAALAWLVGTLWGLLTIRPLWIVVALAATALAAGAIHGAEYRRRVILFVLPLVVGVGAGAYFVESAISNGDQASAIPPSGTVINTQTGQPAVNVQRSTPQIAQLEFGHIFRACDRTTEHPCRYDADQGAIKAKPGDLLEFGIRLHNGNDASVPYAHLTVESWGGDGTIIEHSSSGAVTDRRAPVAAKLDIEYKTGISHDGIEETVEIDVPESSGYTALNYVLGSTVLVDRQHHLVARLPDGIMDGGLALADIGSPSSCYFCDLRYTRLVFFRARVNDGAP